MTRHPWCRWVRSRVGPIYCRVFGHYPFRVWGSHIHCYCGTQITGTTPTGTASTTKTELRAEVDRYEPDLRDLAVGDNLAGEGVASGSRTLEGSKDLSRLPDAPSLAGTVPIFDRAAEGRLAIRIANQRAEIRRLHEQIAEMREWMLGFKMEEGRELRKEIARLRSALARSKHNAELAALAAAGLTSATSATDAERNAERIQFGAGLSYGPPIGAAGTGKPPDPADWVDEDAPYFPPLTAEDGD